MFPDLFPPDRCYDPRRVPLPTPDVGILDAPLVSFSLNVQWVSHLDGILERLLYPDAWTGTDEQVAQTIQQVHHLLVLLATGMEVQMSNLGLFGLTILPAVPAGTIVCDGSTHLRENWPAFYAHLESLSSPLIVDQDSFIVPDLVGESITWNGVGPVTFSWVVVAG